MLLWLVKQDWGETILKQMWGSTSLGRGGAFSELKEQFHSGRTPGCQRSTSLMERSLQNPGTSVVHIDVAQICFVPYDVFMIILIKTSRKNVAVHTAVGQDSCKKRSPKEEPSKQIRSQTSCSVTIDSKNHLVTPAVSTDCYPVIQRRCSSTTQ